MKISEADRRDIELLYDAVKHYREDLEEFLQSGIVSELDPKYKKELPFYKRMKQDYRRCQILEKELKNL